MIERLRQAWSRLFKPRVASDLHGRTYRSVCKLYSKDGKREVEVLEFDNGEAYLVEREVTENGTFVDRHSGRMVGPFVSPETAEKFIVGTAWFCGRDA